MATHQQARSPTRDEPARGFQPEPATLASAMRLPSPRIGSGPAGGTRLALARIGWGPAGGTRLALARIGRGLAGGTRLALARIGSGPAGGTRLALARIGSGLAGRTRLASPGMESGRVGGTRLALVGSGNGLPSEVWLVPSRSAVQPMPVGGGVQFRGAAQRWALFLDGVDRCCGALRELRSSVSDRWIWAQPVPPPSSYRWGRRAR